MRTAKTAVQNTCQSGFRIATIRTGMHSPVATDESEDWPLTTDHCMRQHHQQSRETGWDIVGHIIDTGCPTAKVLVTFRLVANHRVERVYHLIRYHARNTQYGKPEQGSYHTVTQIFCQRFEGSGTHLLSRKFRSVTPHDTSHLCPTLL